MTNEDLVIQIQLGHTERYSELWENCRKLLIKILWEKIKKYPLPNYMSHEDLEQELYFALCLAVQAYDIFKPYVFVSYLSFSVLRVLRNLLPKEPIKESSYNRLAGDDEDTELIDLIEDEAAGRFYERTELTDLQTKIREAVAELPTRERRVIDLHYLKNKPYKDIAKSEGVSIEVIRDRNKNGLRILGRNKRLCLEYNSMCDHYNGLESQNYYSGIARL